MSNSSVQPVAFSVDHLEELLEIHLRAMEAIPIRLEAIASRLEALEAIPSRWRPLLFMSSLSYVFLSLVFFGWPRVVGSVETGEKDGESVHRDSYSLGC